MAVQLAVIGALDPCCAPAGTGERAGVVPVPRGARRGHQRCSASSERSAARLSSSAVSWARCCFSSRLTCFSSARACRSRRYRSPCWVLTSSSTSRRSSRSHGFPCIAAGRYCSLPALIAAMISSCVSPNSARAVLSLSVAPLRPHSSPYSSMTGHCLAQRVPASWRFAPLPTAAEGELEQTVADHRDARTGLALVVPGLPAAHQRLAVLGPGEVPPPQDLPEHGVHRVRVGGRQALQRQRRDRLRPQVAAQHVRQLTS